MKKINGLIKIKTNKNNRNSTNKKITKLKNNKIQKIKKIIIKITQNIHEKINHNYIGILKLLIYKFK